MTMTGKAKLTRMFKKTSAKTGSEYFVGRLGGSRILLFRAREQPDDGDEVFELLIEPVEDDGGAGRAPRPQGQRRKGNVVDALNRLGRDLENAEADRQPRTRRQPQEKAAAEIEDDPIPDFAR